MTKIFILMLAIGALFPVLANAEIYKWKDTNGVVRYSDTPPPSGIPSESIRTRRIVVTDSPVVKDKQEGSQAEAIKRQEVAEENKKKEELQKDKKQNCLLAKDNLRNYKDGATMYKVNDKGEREYLDDAGMKKGMEQAQKDVKQYCE